LFAVCMWNVCVFVYLY